MIDGLADGITVVGKYVDGLHISLYGAPRQAVLETLRTERKASIDSEFGIIPGVPGGPLVLKPRGRGKYPFVVENDALDMSLTDAGRLPGTMPRAKIRVRARALYTYGLGQVESIVEALAGCFVQPGFGVRVSRYDVAVDFQCPGWKMPDRKDIITGLHGKTYDEGPERITGRTFGDVNGTFQVVIYDKTREIKKHHKEALMTGIWAAREAYDDQLPVIRIEFRFFRKALRELKVEDPLTGQLHSIDTLSDLRSSEGDLIRYVVGGDGKRRCFRVASPETRHRRPDRRSAAPWWQEISRSFLEDKRETGRIRRRSPSSNPDHKRAVRELVTYAVKSAALTRLLGLHPVSSSSDFLGPVPLQYLPEWLAAKGFRSFEEAVDREAKKVRGRVAALAPQATSNYVGP